MDNVGNIVSNMFDPSTSGSGAFVDSSANNHVITPYGNVSHSLDQKKFGDTSMYFGGAAADYLTIPDSTDWVFGAGDFTIDSWVRFAVAADDNDIMIQYYILYLKKKLL